MTAPPPRMVAVAIADMVRDRAIEAWHYLDDWAALTRYGVPARALRHGLEVERKWTEALSLTSEWMRAGERGLLGLCGSYGCGKSFAAVRWAVNRHRRGRRIFWWLASRWPNKFEDRDELLTRVANVDALVVDDLGDGQTKIKSLAEDWQSLVTGKISERLDVGRPTMVISNAPREEVADWLGGRIVDRLSFGGGINQLAAAPSLRAPDTVQVDSEGRSPRWNAARRLVDMIGVERDDDVWRIGGVLEVQTSLCTIAMRELDLDPAAVHARALELLEQDRETIARLASEIGEPMPVGSVLDLNWSTVGPMVHERIARGAERAERERVERNARYASERERVAASLRPSDVEPPSTVPPLTVEGARQLAVRYGLRAVMADGDRFEVRHGERVLASGQWSRAQAWWVAAELIRRATAPALCAVGADE